MEATTVQQPKTQTRTVPMGIRVNKDGKLVKSTVKIKDLVVSLEVNFPLLILAAIMISILNILYLTSIF
jgi:hypothetical protein